MGKKGIGHIEEFGSRNSEVGKWQRAYRKIRPPAHRGHKPMPQWEVGMRPPAHRDHRACAPAGSRKKDFGLWICREDIWHHLKMLSIRY